MPHGIVLLTSPKNNNSCYLLFEQPSSGHFHATCASSYLCSPSRNLLASTKSTHCHLSPRSEETNASSSSSSCLHSWCSPHNLGFVTKSPVCRLSSRIPQALSYSSDHPSSENFYCRNGVLATNIISTDSAPHQRCQHPTKGALLHTQANGLATFLALLLIDVRHPLLTTSLHLPGSLLPVISSETIFNVCHQAGRAWIFTL